ncbi:MAG: 4-hydroxythreonine-4-phosphate dehydrogenase PdxA [Gaiellales bacterium]
MNEVRPRLAVTVGDPAGVGPEVVVAALADEAVAAACDAVVFGDPAWLGTVACRLGVPVPREVVPAAPVPDGLVPGRASAEGGEAAWQSLVAAVEACRRGEADALVTAPLNKVALDLAGHGHHGHTEILQRLTGSPWSLTLFLTGTLRVLFYTRHVSLREAIDAISAGGICETLERFCSVAPAIGLARPRIAVAGINPHCGEGGRFGTEELEHIAPGVELARSRGLDVHGPVPGDTVFQLARRGDYDIVLSFSHDQAAGIGKSIDFAGTVSVTLGLPFLRVSVDHGTAFDLVGHNLADPANMRTALLSAAKLLAHGAGRSGLSGPETPIRERGSGTQIEKPLPG